MYRDNAAPEPTVPAASAEFVYLAVDSGRRGKSMGAMFQFFSLPVLLTMVMGYVAGTTAATVALLAGVAHSIWLWKRAPVAGSVVLRTKGNILTVLASNKRRVLGEFSFEELDVVMDTETTRDIQEGGDAIPVMRMVNATVGPERDISRIVLEGKGKRLPLTKEFVRRMDATESFGKIRVFLRKQGWVPADERGEAETAESADERGEAESEAEVGRSQP